jgi:hypothetical protein
MHGLWALGHAEEMGSLPQGCCSLPGDGNLPSSTKQPAEVRTVKPLFTDLLPTPSFHTFPFAATSAIIELM